MLPVLGKILHSYRAAQAEIRVQQVVDMVVLAAHAEVDDNPIVASTLYVYFVFGSAGERTRRFNFLYDAAIGFLLENVQ